MICSKLLRNENVFRSYIESTAELKGLREEEKLVEVADLRQVLAKFGLNFDVEQFEQTLGYSPGMTIYDKVNLPLLSQKKVRLAPGPLKF